VEDRIPFNFSGGPDLDAVFEGPAAYKSSESKTGFGMFAIIETLSDGASDSPEDSPSQLSN